MALESARAYVERHGSNEQEKYGKYTFLLDSLSSRTLIYFRLPPVWSPD